MFCFFPLTDWLCICTSYSPPQNLFYSRVMILAILYAILLVSAEVEQEKALTIVHRKNLHVHFLLKALKLRCWRKYHGFHLFPFLFFSLIVWHETCCHIKRHDDLAYNDSNFFFLTKEKRNSRIRCRIFNSSSKQC